MKTVNLELSIQLREAGYPQRETAFYWTKDYQESSCYFTHNPTVESIDKNWNIASPTADEILDQLPLGYFVYRIKLVDTGNVEWLISDNANIDELTKNWERSESLADAAAKMWLYLKEENLI